MFLRTYGALFPGKRRPPEIHKKKSSHLSLPNPQANQRRTSTKVFGRAGNASIYAKKMALSALKILVAVRRSGVWPLRSSSYCNPFKIAALESGIVEPKIMPIVEDTFDHGKGRNSAISGRSLHGMFELAP